MAYINQDEKKLIAAALKKAFPSDRFSLSVKHYSSLIVKIVKAELLEKYHGKELAGKRYGDEYIRMMDFSSDFRVDELRVESQFKQYPELSEYFAEIVKIIKEVGGHYNHSDYMVDYHDVAFYYDVKVCLKGVAPLEQV